MQLYESGEMYLETILNIMKQKGNVRAIDVVSNLGHAKSTVSEALKNLAENGYIVVSSGNISLTDKGKAIAENIYERHTILTDYLVRLGVEKKRLPRLTPARWSTLSASKLSRKSKIT